MSNQYIKQTKQQLLSPHNQTINQTTKQPNRTTKKPNNQTNLSLSLSLPIFNQSGVIVQKGIIILRIGEYWQKAKK
jgi:hypothetical protein